MTVTVDAQVDCDGVVLIKVRSAKNESDLTWLLGVSWVIAAAMLIGDLPVDDLKVAGCVVNPCDNSDSAKGRPIV